MFDFDLAMFLREAEGHKRDVLGEMMQEKVTWCHKPTYSVNAADRSYKTFVHRCKSKDPNVCESCARQYRMDKFELITDTMTHFRLDRMVIIRDGDENILRKLRSEHGLERVIRIPREDGVTILCAVEPVDDDETICREEFTAELIFDMFTTPDTMRITGGYKRSKEEEKRDEEFVKISTTIFVIDSDVDQKTKVSVLHRAHNEAVRRLPDLRPNKDTLQECVDLHESVVSHVLTELGVNFVKLANRKTINVYVSDIDWAPLE